MTDEDHRKLSAVLHRMQGRVVISGYACPLYEELFSGWKRVDREAQILTGEVRVECLWISPEPVVVVQVRIPPERFSPSVQQLRERLLWLEGECDGL